VCAVEGGFRGQAVELRWGRSVTGSGTATRVYWRSGGGRRVAGRRAEHLYQELGIELAKPLRHGVRRELIVEVPAKHAAGAVVAVGGSFWGRFVRRA